MPARLSTIGYEGRTVDELIDALEDDGVALLMDVRAIAASRRPGFSKTALAATAVSMSHGLSTTAAWLKVRMRGSVSCLSMRFTCTGVGPVASASSACVIGSLTPARSLSPTI